MPLYRKNTLLSCHTNDSKDFTNYELDLIHYYKAVRSILFKMTKGDAPDTDTMNAHVQKMLEDAIKSEGVEEVFSTDKDTNAEAVDGRREVWTDYEEAKAYFLEMMITTDGEEHERAACVYIQLLHGLDECSDEEE